MSKNFNTGWVRARGGRAELQGKLRADTEDKKPQGEFQSYSWGLTNTWDTKECSSSKSQSSHTSLERQRKEGSAGTAQVKTQGIKPHSSPCSPPKGVQHLRWLQTPADSTKWEYFSLHRSQDCLWEVGSSDHITSSRNKIKQFLLRKLPSCTTDCKN